MNSREYKDKLHGIYLPKTTIIMRNAYIEKARTLLTNEMNLEQTTKIINHLSKLKNFSKTYYFMPESVYDVIFDFIYSGGIRVPDVYYSSSREKEPWNELTNDNKISQSIYGSGLDKLCEVAHHGLYDTRENGTNCI